MKGIKNIFYILFFAFFITACSDYNPSPTPSLGYNSTKFEQEGLSFATRAYLKKEDVKKYFDKDLLAYDILPVKLFVRNESNNFVNIMPTFIGISINNSEEVKPMNSIQVYDRLRANTSGKTLAATIFTGGLGLIPVSMTNAETNDKLRRWIENTSIKTASLKPRESIEGVLYYPISSRYSGNPDAIKSIVLHLVSNGKDYYVYVVKKD